MSIKDLIEKINPVVNFGTAPEVPENLGAKIYYRAKPFYTLLLILVVASIFFGLGRLSAIEERHSPIKVEYPNATSTAVVLSAISVVNQPDQSENNIAVVSSGKVVGSKTGKKYYFPWCGGLKRVKPENQVNFTSVEEARSAGYLPAGNCKGLK